jgi:hypothetical protein
MRGNIVRRRSFVGHIVALILPAVILQPAAAGDIEEAVKLRRGQTNLSKLAAGMSPGTWAKLQTEMPKGMWISPRVEGRGGLHIAGWTDDAHWDSRSGQFLYMGMRQTRQFIAYSETANAWRALPLDRDGDNPVFQTKFGHIYGNNAFDAATSRFYHRYGGFGQHQGGISYFDVAAEKWTRLPPAPSVGSAAGSGMCIEYFSARKGLAILGAQVRFFSDERQAWGIIGRSPVDGYHSLFRHNPFREEILMAGGNNNRRIVARLKKDGAIERLRDAPADLGVNGEKITVDPVSGCYLIMHREHKLYEFDSDTNEYRLVDDFSKTPWPFHRYDMPIVAFIPEYGITMWAGTNNVWLYKQGASK